MPSKSKQTRSKRSSGKILRFAHPFFNASIDSGKAIVPETEKRMTDYVQTKLLPIPAPSRTPAMMLEEIIGIDGVKAVEKAGFISFHVVGDTGHENGRM